MICLKCGCEGLVKNGFVGGVQRYKCKNCDYQMTRTTARGRPLKEKNLALLLYVSGVSMNRIGQIIGVTAQSVMRWLRKFATVFSHELETQTSFEEPLELEIDEMHHYLKKKTANSGFGKFMIVPLSDASRGPWVIVPLKHSNP
jgi:transposase